jgi:hypothetical protein
VHETDEITWAKLELVGHRGLEFELNTEDELTRSRSGTTNSRNGGVGCGIVGKWWWWSW